MADLDKVIKDWESILSRDPLDIPWDLIDDTLTLLKEQEKRINELEEKLRLLEYGDQDTLQSAMMPAT